MALVKLFTYTFWIVFISIYYIIYKYSYSKNKRLFFKTGSYRSVVWIFSVLIALPLIINLLMPDELVSTANTEVFRLDNVTQQNLLKRGEIFSYYGNIVVVIGKNINFVGFASATLILITWFIYIYKIDVFQSERLKYLLSALVMGMVSSIFVFLISDIVNLYYEIKYTDSFLHNLFIYCFLGIGVVEELIKLIPFFIIWRFTEEINEPYDYILYASVSALGFAFVENLIYFKELDGLIIQGRALMSVVGHVLFSSFAVYGLVIAKYRYQKSEIQYFILSFLLAAFLHGLYDYLIFESLIAVVLFIFIFAIQSWTIIVNNAINNSSFFNFNLTFQAEKLRFFLAVMLTSILGINYFVNTLQYGKEIANANYLSSCLYSGLFVIFYVTNLSNYDLVKGYWRPVAFKTSPANNNQLPGNRGIGSLLSIFKYNFISPLNIVNYKISIHPPHYNNLLYGIMDVCYGKIIDRVCLYDQAKNSDNEYTDIDWFLVEMNQALSIHEYIDYTFISTHVLIKLENKGSSLIHDEDVRGVMRLIPDFQLLKTDKPQMNNFASAGYIIINCPEVPEYLK